MKVIKIILLSLFLFNGSISVVSACDSNCVKVIDENTHLLTSYLDDIGEKIVNNIYPLAFDGLRFSKARLLGRQILADEEKVVFRYRLDYYNLLNQRHNIKIKIILGIGSSNSGFIEAYVTDFSDFVKPNTYNLDHFF